MASFKHWEGTGMFILWLSSRLCNSSYLVGTILGTEDAHLALYRSNPGVLLQLKIQILSRLSLKLFLLTTLRITPNLVHGSCPPWRPGDYCTSINLAALFLVLSYSQLLFLPQVFCTGWCCLPEHSSLRCIHGHLLIIQILLNTVLLKMSSSKIWKCPSQQSKDVPHTSSDIKHF